MPTNAPTSPASKMVQFLLSSHLLKVDVTPTGTAVAFSSPGNAGINTTLQVGTTGRSSREAERMAYSWAKTREARSNTDGEPRDADREGQAVFIAEVETILTRC